MAQKSISRAVLIVVLSVALATPTRAHTPGLELHPNLIGNSNGGGFQKIRDEVVIGIVVAAVAVVVVVVVVIRHRPQRITGCVNSGGSAMRMTDEKDKRSYALSGNMAGVKAGYRMMLEGKRKHAGQTLAFETHKVGRDFGVCQP